MKAVLIVLIFFLSFNLFGQEVFLANTKGKADLKVYVSTDTTLSDVDLLVFITEDSNQVVKDGIWYYSKSESNSAFTVKYVNKKKNADIVISFVTFIEDARWLRRVKVAPHKYKKSREAKKSRKAKESKEAKKSSEGKKSK